MPKVYDWNNTGVSTPIKKIYDWDRTTGVSTPIKKVYDWDWAVSRLVYQSVPDSLFPVTDNNRNVVGGFEPVAIEHGGNQWTVFYGTDAGRSAVSDGEISLYHRLNYSVRTSNRIDFDEYKFKSITINGYLQIGGWGYDDEKFDNNLTYASVRIGFTSGMNSGDPILSTFNLYDGHKIEGYSGNVSALKPDSPMFVSFTIQEADIPQSGSYYLYISDHHSVPWGDIKLTITSITTT